MNARALTGLAKLTAAAVIGWLYLHGYGQGPAGLLTRAKNSLTTAPPLQPPKLGAGAGPYYPNR